MMRRMGDDEPSDEEERREHEAGTGEKIDQEEYGSDLEDFREVPERHSKVEIEEDEERERQHDAASQELKCAVLRIANAKGKEKSVTISKQLVTCIHELAVDFCDSLQSDLEQFAKHAKRTTISVEDVRLCARRNESLLKLLDDFAAKNLKLPTKRKRTANKAPEGVDATKP